MRAERILGLLAAATLEAQSLPGTRPLTREGDLAMQMVASIDRYLSGKLASSPQRRARPGAGSRERLRKLIGVVDPRAAFEDPLLISTLDRPGKVGESVAFEVFAVRWPALDGVDAEGLLLKPKSPPKAYVVLIPDADRQPEQLAADPGGALASSGCLVLIPSLIDRSDRLSGNPAIRFTNQPHREFIHRMSYEMGRHIIGYEVQKVLAAVDWFGRLPKAPVGVAGYGEGGLLALFAAAIDERIDAVSVAGYFQKREDVVWSEPIYRNVWSQLETWGDAELAALVAPRALIINPDAAHYPEVDGPPPARDGRRGAASGRLVKPRPEAVRSEFERAKRYHPGAQLAEDSTRALLAALKVEPRPGSGDLRIQSDPAGRIDRQFRQMVDYTQRLMRLSEFRRKEYFAGLNTTDMAKFAAGIEPYRKYFWEEVQGKMPPPEHPLTMAETRKVYDTPAYTGHEVLIPVWGEVYAYGILLVPKSLKPGERRPAVVAQHGLEGRPQDVIQPKDERTGQIYARFGEELARQGYIVFAPQNPYIGMETFRLLMRKANPVKLSLFSFIIGQHDRILDFLETLPYVDKSRIGFYGLSYGGKTAMRVPSLVTRYALSICSGDFNEWVWKVVSTDAPFSYMFTQEYDMLEFDLGHTFNYFEQAMLIAPRPFMVERGHRDGVGIDEWVSAEYAKVRRFYTYLGIGDRTEIEYFDGPHQIHGVGTYAFLAKHLKWTPEK